MPARRTVQLNIPVFLISAVCMYAMVIISQVIGNWVGAHKSPFACDDYSIHNPLMKQTIPTPALLMMTILLSVAVIILIEFIVERISKADTKFKFRSFKLPRLLVHIIAFESYFQLGYVMQILATQTTKYAVGRLRPHFYTVCQPLNLTCGSPGQLIYDYECTGDVKDVDEGRLSFFSGHSSLSMYTATFLIIYIQARVGHIAPRLILSTVQTFLFSAGLFVCYTRISDYYHHPSDVAVGMMVGILGAIYTCYAWADFCGPREGYSPVHGRVIKPKVAKEEVESAKNPSSVLVDLVDDTKSQKTEKTDIDQLSTRLPPSSA